MNKKRRFSMQQKQSIVAYIFLLPFIVGFVYFFAIPLIKSIQFSFSYVQVDTGGYVLQNAGWANYNKLFFVDAYFRSDLLASVVQLLPQVLIIVIFSFFAANLLNQKFKGRGLARAIMFLPIILTSGVILSIEMQDLMLTTLSDVSQQTASLDGNSLAFFQSMNELFYSLNLPMFLADYLVMAVEGIYNIIIASGVQILVFLAGLQSIPRALYEASDIEGATAWENFWKITFPMVTPLILVNIIYSIIDAFLKPNNQMMINIYNQAFSNANYGASSAMAIVYFIVVVLIIGVTTGLISRKVFYHD